MAALATAELGARLVIRTRTPAGMVFDPEILYTYRPDSRAGSVHVNALGCIGDDLRGSSRPRVLLLGGSTSFSTGYVDAVRRRLRHGLALPGAAVMSAGKPRYTSAVNRNVLARLAPVTEPDAVVVYLGINDTIYDSFPWVDDIPRVGYFDWRDPSRSLLLTLLDYHLVDKRLRSRPDFGPAELRSPAILRRNVEAILDLTDRVGARGVLSTFAIALPTSDRRLAQRVADDEPVMEHFWGRVGSTRLAVEAHNRVMRSLATAHGVALADVAAAIPRDGDHFVDICHLRPAGNEILGRHVADAVAEALRGR